MYWLGFSRCTSNTHTKPTTLSTFICVSGVKPPTHLNSPNQTSLHLTVQIFSLGCVVAERHLIAHTHTLPLSRPTVSASSQSVGISSKYLSQTKRSICPPVCLRWPSTPNSSPAPLSRPHLTLAADWLASSSVASVCVCVCDSVSAFLNGGDEMMLGSWLVELCQAEQMGGDWALPAETNYQYFFSKTNILQPKNHVPQSRQHRLCPFSRVQTLDLARPRLSHDVLVITVALPYIHFFFVD